LPSKINERFYQTNQIDTSFEWSLASYFVKLNATHTLMHSVIVILFFLICDRKYSLDDNTIDFIGHALALHSDDCHLAEPAQDTVKRMKVSLFYLFTCLLLF